MTCQILWQIFKIFENKKNTLFLNPDSWKMIFLENKAPKRTAELFDQHDQQLFPL